MINALITCSREVSMSDVDPHGKTISFGRHKGTRFTRLPISYLKWMVCQRTQAHEIAAAELKRREVVTPKVEISGHAIDRFSQKFLTVWEDWRLTANHDTYEGLHAFLVRLAEEAAQRAHFQRADVVQHHGVLWVFELGGVWPVLKTVK